MASAAASQPDLTTTEIDCREIVAGDTDTDGDDTGYMTPVEDTPGLDEDTEADGMVNTTTDSNETTESDEVHTRALHSPSPLPPPRVSLLCICVAPSSSHRPPLVQTRDLPLIPPPSPVVHFPNPNLIIKVADAIALVRNLRG